MVEEMLSLSFRSLAIRSRLFPPPEFSFYERAAGRRQVNELFLESTADLLIPAREYLVCIN